MSDEETKYFIQLQRPLGNPDVEHLARVMATEANYIRDPDHEDEFEKLEQEPKYAFRTMASRYAEILGVDPGRGGENGKNDCSRNENQDS